MPVKAAFRLFNALPLSGSLNGGSRFLLSPGENAAEQHRRPGSGGQPAGVSG